MTLDTFPIQLPIAGGTIICVTPDGREYAIETATLTGPDTLRLDLIEREASEVDEDGD